MELYCLFWFALFCSILTSVNAFNYDSSFLAEVKTKVSEQCYRDMARGGKDLREFVRDAVSAWNAKTPGLVNGTHDYTGNYEACLRPNSNGFPKQYCVFDVALTYENEVLEPCHPDSWMGHILCLHNGSATPYYVLKWALCSVDSCSKLDLQTMAEVLVQKSDIGRAGLAFNVSLPTNTCQSAVKTSFGTDTIIFFYLIGAIAAMVAICTIWDWSYRTTSHEPDVKVPALVRNWSLIENFSSLMEISSSEIRIFHSLRVITMYTIIITHEIMFLTYGPVANFETLYFYLRLFGYLRFDFPVDVCLAMGGFIVANNFLSSSRDKPLFELALTRYFRFLPVLALVIFYATSVMEYTGQGPFWPIIAGTERETCVKSWWFSFLVLGNYGPWKEHCWTVSWYVPCDFYFYIVGVLICRLIKKDEKLGVSVLYALLVTSMVYAAFTIGYNNYIVLPSLAPPMFNDKLRSIRSLESMENVYIRSYFRASSYLVGMLGGYLAHVYTQKKLAISKSTAMRSFMWSVTIMGMTFTSGLFFGSHSALKAAVYGTLLRPMWALGFVLFVLTLTFGKIHFPKMAAFLEKKMWIPLSKLTFCMFLTHMAVIYRAVGVQVQPFYFGDPVILVRVVVDLILAVVVALVLYLCVEKPSYGLFKLSLENYRKWRKYKTE